MKRIFITLFQTSPLFKGDGKDGSISFVIQYDENYFMDPFQSPCKKVHDTKTAISCPQRLDQRLDKFMVCLFLLGLSADFDTVDNIILLIF